VRRADPSAVILGGVFCASATSGPATFSGERRSAYPSIRTALGCHGDRCTALQMGYSGALAGVRTVLATVVVKTGPDPGVSWQPGGGGDVSVM
jgi:hypothetical protein